MTTKVIYSAALRISKRVFNIPCRSWWFSRCWVFEGSSFWESHEASKVFDRYQIGYKCVWISLIISCNIEDMSLFTICLYILVKSDIIGTIWVCIYCVSPNSFKGSRVGSWSAFHFSLSVMCMFINLSNLAGETYQQTDAEFLNSEKDNFRDDGSTASTAVLVDNRLYVANVGDSRTVISKAGKGNI